jgi:hypothetical protein
VGSIEKQTVQSGEPRVRLPSEDVLIGVYGYKIPLAFLIWGEADSVAIHLGIWSPARRENPSAKMLDDRQEILKAALNSLYPAIELASAEVELSRAPVSGFALGVPTAKPPNPLDDAVPLDRLIRALFGTNWACLVLAEPVDESATRDFRNKVINEMRSVQAAAQAEGAPSPLAEQYIELLNLALKALTSGLEVGAWRTGVYLLGDTQSYYRLASVWRGIFSGDESLPEPVRVWDSPAAAELAVNWALPETDGSRGAPGYYHHPRMYQTLLTSTQLAAYIHLPQLETSGFSISMVPNFDTVPREVDREDVPIGIGKVLQRESLMKERFTEAEFNMLPNTHYEVGLSALAKHVFVPGATGFGKTTTIFNLLKNAWRFRVPFLTIEPAKTEYRELLKHKEVGRELQVFTVGNEQESPVRINPFEVLSGTPVSVHIDLLRSVFSASFGLWTPLPQILEKCLHLIYRDKGWDVAADCNRRAPEGKDPRAPPILSEAFPTLSDLIAKVDEVMSRSVWDPEATARIRGSLRDRLNALRNGAKGRMLDVQRSLPMEVFLEHPTVLELEGLGDDDDKAFMMALLLIRLVEYRRDQGKPPDDKLRHLLVFEEAHRLLTNVASREEEGAANPRAKAVESFTNLLSEIRAYGQGVIIADQIPVKLAPDVIKNTNLKIAHRIVDLEDREVLGGSMHMTEQQASALTNLPLGRAAVFRAGEDAPLLVQIPPPPKVDKLGPDEISKQMSQSDVLANHRDLFLAHPGCTDVGKHSGAACEAARSIVEDPTFRRDFVRLVLSLVDDSSALARLWPTIEWRVVASLRPGINQATLLRCTMARGADWFATRRGAQAGWSYRETADLSDVLHKVLVMREDKENGPKAIKALQDSLRALHERRVPPYAHCERICTQRPPVCLYRQAVEDMIGTGDFTSAWNDSDPLGASSTKAASWAVCQRAAEQIVEWKPAQQATIRRIGLCYGQQMLLRSALAISPEYGNNLFDNLYHEAENTELKFYGP